MDPKDALYWIFRVMMFVVIIVFIFYARDRFMQLGTSSYDIENYVYLERAINRLSYLDPETGRLYPGIIDIEEFNETSLEGTFGETTPFGFKMVIEDLEGNPLAGELVYNSDQYGFIEPLSRISDKYINMQSKRYVIARTKEGELVQAKLKINFLFKTVR